MGFFLCILALALHLLATESLVLDPASSSPNISSLTAGANSSSNISADLQKAGSVWKWQKPLDDIIDDYLTRTDLWIATLPGSKLKLEYVEDLYMPDPGFPAMDPAYDRIMPYSICFLMSVRGRRQKSVACTMFRVDVSAGTLTTGALYEDSHREPVPAPSQPPSQWPPRTSFTLAYNVLRYYGKLNEVRVASMVWFRTRYLWQFESVVNARTPSMRYECWGVDAETNDLIDLNSVCGRSAASPATI